MMMPGPDEVIASCREHWETHVARYEERCWTCALHFAAIEQKRTEDADDKSGLYAGELFDRLKILNGQALDADWLVERLLDVAPDRLPLLPARERWAQEFGRRTAEVAIAELRTSWTAIRLNEAEDDQELYAAEVAGARADGLLAAAKNDDWTAA